MATDILFTRIKQLVLYLFIFLFPLFFLPTTQEYFVTNKFYLTALVAVILIITSTLELLATRKMVWKKTIFDTTLILFLVAIGLSTLLVSPNKFQALVNPDFGLISMASLVTIFFYLTRFTKANTAFKVLSISAALVSLLSIIFFFQPFKTAHLPVQLQFLQNPLFTPVGNMLDLIFFLGFTTLLSGINMYKHIRVRTDEFSFYAGIFGVVLLGLVLSLFTFFRSALSNPNGFVAALALPPFRLSWYAAVDIMKYPLNAVFGIGVDNFSTIFTHVKDAIYNTSPIWQIETFNASRSTILHIFTETGLLGGISFIVLLLVAFKHLFGLSDSKKSSYLEIIISFLAVILVIALFPPSLFMFFLFFFILSIVMQHDKHETRIEDSRSAIDLSNIAPLYIGIPLLALVVVGFIIYFLGKNYLAEYYFKKSIDGYTHNNATEVYNNQQKAVITNPYIERFRINFGQTNLLIANNIASQTTHKKSADGKDTATLTDQQKQSITQAIQTAISESKAAVTLNSQKATNWENLANIYRNILNVAQDADVWTISSFQRAMALDPANPTYPFTLGSVYYAAKNYDNAINLFAQSVNLKQNWPNAHYNLAWSEYQKGNYQAAATELQNVLALLNPQKDKADYDRVNKELDQFKKKIPDDNAVPAATGEAQQKNNLTLPSPAANKIEPKLELPKQASPEAK